MRMDMTVHATLNLASYSLEFDVQVLIKCLATCRERKAETKFAKKLKGTDVFRMLMKQNKAFDHQPVASGVHFTKRSIYFWAEDLKEEAMKRGWKGVRGASRPAADAASAKQPQAQAAAGATPAKSQASPTCHTTDMSQAATRKKPRTKGDKSARCPSPPAPGAATAAAASSSSCSLQLPQRAMSSVAPGGSSAQRSGPVLHECLSSGAAQRMCDSLCE